MTCRVVWQEPTHNSLKSNTKEIFPQNQRNSTNKLYLIHHITTVNVYECHGCWCKTFSVLRYHIYHQKMINFYIFFLTLKNIFVNIFICIIYVRTACLFRCWTVYFVKDGRWKEGSQNCLLLMSARFKFLSTAFCIFLCWILWSLFILNTYHYNT
jgi:hypothetical protein